jgi:hypothetical protein
MVDYRHSILAGTPVSAAMRANWTWRIYPDRPAPLRTADCCIREVEYFGTPLNRRDDKDNNTLLRTVQIGVVGLDILCVFKGRAASNGEF